MCNSKLGIKKSLPSSIDGMHDDQDIANHSANSFAKSCSPRYSVKNAALSEQFSVKWSSYAGDVIGSLEDDAIDARTIDTIVSELKLGKAAGLDSLTSEHLKYAHPIVHCLLSKLFNLMIDCDYVPDAFGIGLTVPLPKHDSLSKLCSTGDF